MIRDIKLTIRLSDEEENTIEGWAKKANVSKSEYVRKRALEQDITGSAVKSNAATHLIHVQNLLNTISCVHNQNKEIIIQIRNEVDAVWPCFELD